MNAYLSVPVLFLQFWFIEAPRSLFSFFLAFNKAFLQLFSLPLLVKTYFKPWKNEYRKGLIGFSVAMGMFIKTWVILLDLLFFFVILLIEIAVILGFVLWPFATIAYLFYG